MMDLLWWSARSRPRSHTLRASTRSHRSSSAPRTSLEARTTHLMRMVSERHRHRHRRRAGTQPDMSAHRPARAPSHPPASLCVPANLCVCHLSILPRGVGAAEPRILARQGGRRQLSGCCGCRPPRAGAGRGLDSSIIVISIRSSIGSGADVAKARRHSSIRLRWGCVVQPSRRGEADGQLRPALRCACESLEGLRSQQRRRLSLPLFNGHRPRGALHGATAAAGR